MTLEGWLMIGVALLCAPLGLAALVRASRIAAREEQGLREMLRSHSAPVASADSSNGAGSGGRPFPQRSGFPGGGS